MLHYTVAPIFSSTSCERLSEHVNAYLLDLDPWVEGTIKLHFSTCSDDGDVVYSVLVEHRVYVNDTISEEEAASDRYDHDGTEV